MHLHQRLPKRSKNLLWYCDLVQDIFHITHFVRPHGIAIHQCFNEWTLVYIHKYVHIFYLITKLHCCRAHKHHGNDMWNVDSHVEMAAVDLPVSFSLYRLTHLPWTKWPPFHRRHVQTHSWMKIFEFQIKFHWKCSLVSNWQYIGIGSDNSLAQSRRQAIIWTNAVPVHRCICAALGGDELKKKVFTDALNQLPNDQHQCDIIILAI